MYILGLTAYMHDSAACLLRDGRIVAFAEEERFRRVKHCGEFPREALGYCLREAGIDIREVEHIGFFWKPWLGLAERAFQAMALFPKSVFQSGERCGRLWDMLRLKGQLRREWGYRNALHYVDHHDAHVCSAYFCSPFESAAVLTIDGNGEICATRFGLAEGNRIRRIRDTNYPHSLGVLYLCVTEYLGFRENSGEGKVMGLAAYGQPKYMAELRRVLRLMPNGGLKLDVSFFDVHLKKRDYVTGKFIELFGPRREKEGALDQRHMDIAASVQLATEEAGLHMLSYLKRASGQSRLCLAGGVTLNSVMNGRFLREGPFEDLYVQPAANDAGCALGAALYVHHVLLRRCEREVVDHAFWGPAYSEEACRRALDDSGLRYQRPKNVSRACARMIADGKIVGWYQGRMEVGPRALGNRSILADPRDPDMKDILNKRVKHREGFRPFAPVVLQERCGDWFDSDHPSPFMLMVYNVLPRQRDRVPAITHVDGTARVQTIARTQNAAYYDLVREFERITGVPVVLNTSFNVRGEPIVCTPSEAVKCFQRTEMDALALGPFVAKSSRVPSVTGKGRR